MPGDHFYTLSQTTPAAYSNEGIACLVYAEDHPEFSTVGVYRYYNPQTTDHYYTPDKGQGNLAETQGYKIENNGNPEFYIFKRSLGCDTVPFYQWHIGTDHFYTTHPTGELAPFLGGQYQGIIGYVFPASAPVVGSLKQLHRYFKPQ